MMEGDGVKERGLGFRKELQDAKRGRGSLCLKKDKTKEGYT